jgi:putative FmdB family regulatory protein
MPTYEYKCDDCGFMMEKQVPVEERDTVWECVCNKPMKRVYNAVPIKFNSTGFYSTGG